MDMKYTNTLILAPMVRIGTLPMRLLSIKYGADIVYSPETVDKRLIRATRSVNATLGTVDFLDAKSTLCLRIHPSETKKLIVQLGSACPLLAVQAAQIVEKDCAGIDLNCGCPKPFSTLGNMGSALLTQPILLCSILSALVEHIPLPITCKIRLLPLLEDTISLVKQISDTGVKAIAIHCRTKTMRSDSTSAMWHDLKEIQKATHLPIIVNGDVFTMEDIKAIQSQSSITSFMVARAAQANPFVFTEMKRYMHQINKENELDTNTILDPDLVDVMHAYSKLAMQYDMPFQNCKYTLCQMSPSRGSHIHRNVCEKLGIAYFHGTMSGMKGYKGLAELFKLDTWYTALLDSRRQTVKTDTGDYSELYSYIPSGVILPMKRKEIEIEG